MESLGLDVEIHYVENYISLPVSASLTLYDGQELESCITHSYGASTLAGGLAGGGGVCRGGAGHNWQNRGNEGPGLGGSM